MTLVFYNETLLGGHAGCRDYLASYEASGDNLTLIYEVMLDGECRVEDGSLGLDAELLEVMAPKADLRINEEWLEIRGERGGLLVFERLPAEMNLDLAGPAWTLLALVGPNPYVEEPDPWPFPVGVLPGTAITISFEGDSVGGSAGCNDYGAEVSLDGVSIGFGAIVSTEMACLDPEGLMEQETRYLELLAGVTGYSIYGDRLWLETGDGRALVYYAP